MVDVNNLIISNNERTSCWWTHQFIPKYMVIYHHRGLLRRISHLKSLYASEDSHGCTTWWYNGHQMSMFGLPFAHSSAPIAQTASLGDCYIIKHCEFVMDISDHSQLLGLVIHQVTRICNGHCNDSHSWRMPIPHKPFIQTIDLPSSLATSPHFSIVELLSIPSHLQSFTNHLFQYSCLFMNGLLK